MSALPIALDSKILIRDFRAHAVTAPLDRRATTTDLSDTADLTDPALVLTFRRSDQFLRYNEAVESVFAVEQPTSHAGTNIVAFRTKSGRYLTQPLYGDEIHRILARELARNRCMSETGLVALILSFVLVSSSTSDGFEGAGFVYLPMTTQVRT